MPRLSLPVASLRPVCGSGVSVSRVDSAYPGDRPSGGMIARPLAYDWIILSARSVASVRPVCGSGVSASRVDFTYPGDRPSMRGLLAVGGMIVLLSLIIGPFSLFVLYPVPFSPVFLCLLTVACVIVDLRVVDPVVHINRDVVSFFFFPPILFLLVFSFLLAWFCRLLIIWVFCCCGIFSCWYLLLACLVVASGIFSCFLLLVFHALFGIFTGDYKYTKNGVEDTTIVEKFLEEEGLEEAQRDKILAIIKGMGFKNEVSRVLLADSSLEFGIVQDADRLDAIGAIGIARCFTYGGSKGHVLYGPEILPRQDLSKEKYMGKDEKQTTINHFHEKLFKLKDLMKTNAGKRRAVKRHQFMQDFLTEFYEEWSGRA